MINKGRFASGGRVEGKESSQSAGNSHGRKHDEVRKSLAHLHILSLDGISEYDTTNAAWLMMLWDMRDWRRLRMVMEGCDAVGEE